MKLLTQILTGFVALQHLVFLYIEMFSWTTVGKKIFGKSFPPALFEPTKNLAANQGLYNGFLAAGLIWSLLIKDHSWQLYTSIFFLGCILVAGIYGGITTSKKIFYIQGLPALIVLILKHL